MTKAHRPALMISLFFSLGIFIGKWCALPYWLWAGGASVALLLLMWQRGSVFVYLSVVCVGGLFITQRQLLNVDHIVFISDEERFKVRSLEGMIASDVKSQYSGLSFDFDVWKILGEDKERKASGKVRVLWYGKQDDAFEYGQHLKITGELQGIHDGKNKNGFSYRRYLWEQGVFWNFNIKGDGIEVLDQFKGNFLLSWALQLRIQMENVFYRYLDEREEGFVAALVLGDRSNMPKDLKSIFVNTGTAHILAISGMNMAVITALFFFILRACFVSRQVHFWGTILFLFAYAFLSGWSASVVRACIMSAMILASFALEFESDALNSLGVAAILLLVMDPNNLFDVGFQLSFAAVAGILILFLPFQRLFKFLPGFIRDSMALSLSAWAGTFTIMLYHFHIVTPISILANIPIVPLADLVMFLGLGLAMTGGWSSFLGMAFAGCLKATLSAMILLAQWFNQIPWGHFQWT